MNDKLVEFAEGQLKKVGMADSLSADFIAKMRAGEPLIQNAFQKAYEDGTAAITQHWKKSPSSDNYFLNKFQAEVKPAGQEEARSHTFYHTFKRSLNDEGQQQAPKQGELNFTMKEAYNLLSGRPVLKTVANKAGEPEATWMQLNLKNKQDNGNYEMRSYRPQYGFALEATLKSYPIRELLTPEYKTNLMESLQRGNLQKVTMIGPDKKEEKAYVTPSINGGHLKVYDLERKPVSLDEQVKRQWITPEFSQTLKDSLAKKQAPAEEKKIEQKPKVENKKAPKQRTSKTIKGK